MSQSKMLQKYYDIEHAQLTPILLNCGSDTLGLNDPNNEYVGRAILGPGFPSNEYAKMNKNKSSNHENQANDAPQAFLSEDEEPNILDAFTDSDLNEIEQIFRQKAKKKVKTKQMLYQRMLNILLYTPFK